MPPDTWMLYESMLRSRLLEEAISELWQRGLISGEMHLGTGEEGIIAGVTAHLGEGDAIALDHRPTAALVMRGVDPALILHELLGREEGLCRGMGGHMHLYSREHLAASSGIVGAAGPTAAGFALSAQMLRPGTVAVAFFGEGAMNQGMLMESLNLAAVWKLPVVFVCKDDGWAITSSSRELTGGALADRARGLGVPATEVDGAEVCAVWEAAGEMISRAREGAGPGFLHARCVHFEGHFLGFQVLRLTRDPLREMPRVAAPLTRSLFQSNGGRVTSRLSGLKVVLGSVLSRARDRTTSERHDPIRRLRPSFRREKTALREVEEKVWLEIRDLLGSVLGEVQP